MQMIPYTKESNRSLLDRSHNQPASKSRKSMAATKNGNANNAGSGFISVRVVSRRLVRASDSSMEPHVATFSNLDLLNDNIQLFIACVYKRPRRPTGAGEGDYYKAVCAAFEAHLPSYLNYMFPLAGRIIHNPTSGLPELHCRNQGAELVLAEAGAAELWAVDWSRPNESLKKIPLPFAQELPLSVQLVSFACGGFAVVWGVHHLVGDGSFGAMLVNTWSELVRTGAIGAARIPTHDRSLSFFRPRDPPSYGAAVDGMFRRWDSAGAGHVNALTAEESFTRRLFFVHERDIARLRRMASAAAGGRRATTRAEALSAYLWKLLAGVVASSARLLSEAAAGEKRCRMLWFVDGRPRLTSSPDQVRHALRNYAGNVTSYVLAEASAATVLSKSLAEVAAMARDAIRAPNYDELYQDMVDWVELHKPASFVETPAVGLGSPTLAQTVWASYRIHTDFGFGDAALAVPLDAKEGGLCSGHLYVSSSSPGTGDRSWVVNACIWPRLAAALESDREKIFQPLAAEHLGLTCSGGADYLRQDAERPRL